MREVRLPGWSKIALATLLALGALSMWVLSAPVGAGPDDDFHLASIWCSATAPAGSCVQGAGGALVVPAVISSSAACFAFHPEISGRCTTTFGDATATVKPDRANRPYVYPPGYYDAMGLLVSADPVRSVYAMRFLNVLIGVALVLGALWVAPRGLRQIGLLAFLLAGGPLGWSLLAGNNPSWWALLAVGLVWITFLAQAYAPSPRQAKVAVALGALLVVTAAATRVDAIVYVVVLGGAICIGVRLAGLRGRRLLGLVAVEALACALAAVTTLVSAQASFGTSGTAGTTSSSFGSIVRNLAALPEILLGAFGYWGLGWLDTKLPRGVPIVLTLVVGGVVFYAVRGTPRWALVAWAITIVAFIAIPLRVYYVNGISVGEVIQPRYMLPLLPAVIGLPLIRRDPGRRLRFSSLQSAIIIGAVFVAYAVALFCNIRRYVTGINDLSFDLGRDAEWWSTSLIGPMTAFVLGCACTLALLVLLRPWLSGRSAFSAPRSTVGE